MRSNLRKSVSRELKGIAFLLPALIPLIIFCLYPMGYAIRVSMYNWNMTGTMKFIGLKNYLRFFTHASDLQALLVTFKYVVYILPCSLIFGFLLALLVYCPCKIHTVARTIIFIPHIASIVASCAIWTFLMNPQYGVINKILATFGIPPFRWLNDVKTALLSVSFVTLWRMVGYSMVIFIGAIQNVPEEITEAAKIDGAGKIQTTLRILIPLTFPSSFMLMILNTISIFKMYTVIENLTGGGPAKSTQNLVYLIQQTAFEEYSIGYAFAMSVVLFIIILAVNCFQLTLEKYVNYDN